MSERVQHGVSDARISLVGVQPTCVPPAPMTRLQLLASGLNGFLLFPFGHGILVEPDEYPFTMHLAGGYPIGLVPAEIGHRRSLVRIGRFLWSLYPGVADQGVHFAETFQQQHAGQTVSIALRCFGLAAQKMRPVRRRIVRSQDVPLGVLDVALGYNRGARSTFLSVFDGLPDIPMIPFVDSGQ